MAHSFFGNSTEIMLTVILPDGSRKEFDHSVTVLEVAQSNQAAQRLYIDCGFVVVGRRKDYYRTATGAPEDALVLRNSGPLA